MLLAAALFLLSIFILSTYMLYTVRKIRSECWNSMDSLIMFLTDWREEMAFATERSHEAEQERETPPGQIDGQKMQDGIDSILGYMPQFQKGQDRV